MSKVGIVYKLSKDGNDYYGSTCMTMPQRLAKHREKNVKRKCSSQILFNDGDPNVEILELVLYDNIKELRLVEDKYIKNYPCINTKRAVYNRKENDAKNRIYNNKKQLENYYKHREARNAKKKEKINCDLCNSEVNRGHISRHKKTDKCKQKSHLLIK
tara:strand:+ start:742 stop:1215 length:474 start_codon:yes stop_codon:yes gene_type:complete